MDRAPQGSPLWSGVGKPGDLRDHPADKISARFGSGPGDQEDLSAGSLDYYTITASGLIPDAITLCALLVYLTDACIYS